MSPILRLFVIGTSSSRYLPQVSGLCTSNCHHMCHSSKWNERLFISHYLSSYLALWVFNVQRIYHCGCIFWVYMCFWFTSAIINAEERSFINKQNQINCRRWSWLKPTNLPTLDKKANNDPFHNLMGAEEDELMV